MEIKQIISSGILETYVMGIATEEEIEQVLFYKKQYPEVGAALNEIELEVEAFAFKHAIEPPAGTLAKIEDHIKEIQLRGKSLARPLEFDGAARDTASPKSPYIEIESQSSHMRIHKVWRWIFGAVFLLGKIFLAFAIYYYLETRQAREEIKELKLEIKAGRNR